MHVARYVFFLGIVLAANAACADPNAWQTRTSGGLTGGDDQYINGVRVATFGNQTSLTNASQFGNSGLDLFFGPLIVNNPLSYGWQQTGSTLVINHNQPTDSGCVDGSWGINFAGRGLYPSADEVAICDNVSAATPLATVTQPNFAFNNASSTGYVKWLWNASNQPLCPPSNTAPTSFGPNSSLLNSTDQPVCPSPLPALGTHLTFSPKLSAAVVAGLRSNMIIGTSNNARSAIIAWASDGSSIDVDSWVISINPVLIGFDITAYGDGAQTISIGLNNSVEGQNVVLNVPSGVTDPGTRVSPWGVGYELDFHNYGQAATVNPYNPSAGSPKFIGALNSCSVGTGFFSCNVGDVYTGGWPVAYDVTNGAGAIGSFVNDSTASNAGIGFWDQLGGKALSYGFQETNVASPADASFGITRLGEVQTGIGAHKSFASTTKTYTLTATAQPFSLDGNTTFSSANQPIYTKYWPVSGAASAALLAGNVVCTDGAGAAAFYTVNVGFTVSSTGVFVQSSAGGISASATIGTVTGWVLSVQNNGTQVYPVFQGAAHIGCTAQLQLSITVASQ